MRKVIAYVLLVMVLIGSGCVGILSEHLTPIKNDEEVIAYVVQAGTGKAKDYSGILFPSLATLRKLKHDFEAAVQMTNQELRQLAEQKKLKDDILSGIVANDVKLGEERHEILYDPVTGVVAVGLSLMGVAGGGYLGLSRNGKKLGDLKSQLTDKDHKILGIVASVKQAIEAESEETQEKLKQRLKNGQLPHVRAVVDEALKKLS